MPTKEKHNQTWLNIAKEVSKLSKDPSTKVGAVIVSKDNRNFSIGYNGFAKGYPEPKEVWNNKEEKHLRVIHAEENAIINCPFDTVGCKIYITISPCHRCIPRLINAGIEAVYFGEWYGSEKHKNLVREYINHFREFKKISMESESPKGGKFTPSVKLPRERKAIGRTNRSNNAVKKKDK